MTRLDIRNLVLSWLDDLNATYFTSAQVNVWINNAQTEAAKQLMQAYENYFLRTVSTVTVYGQSDYVLPSDFKKLNRLELVVSGTGLAENRQMLVPTTLNQLMLVGPRPGTPLQYVLKKNRITLDPVPDNTYTLRLYYSNLPVDMTLDTDVPGVPGEYHEYVAVLAAMDGYVKDDRIPDNISMKRDRYLMLMKQEAEDRKIDVPRHFITSDDDYNVLF